MLCTNVQETSCTWSNSIPTQLNGQPEMGDDHLVLMYHISNQQRTLKVKYEAALYVLSG